MKDERKHHDTVDEFSLEQQFHKSDAITFVLVGLTTGRPASDEILVDFKIIIILYGSHR